MDVTSLRSQEKSGLVTANSRACAMFSRPGDLNHVEWVESAHVGNDIDCRVYYSSVNFKDVMLASGKLNVDAVSLGSTRNAIGFEFAGCVIDSGRRVMGFGKQRLQSCTDHTQYAL